jgi:hypothetical protein
VITAIVDGRAVNRYAQHITDREAHIVAQVLATQGIHVEPTEPDGLGVVHLWARGPIDTRVEVTVLRAYYAVADGPFEFHQAAAHA